MYVNDFSAFAEEKETVDYFMKPLSSYELSIWKKERVEESYEDFHFSQFGYDANEKIYQLLSYLTSENETDECLETLENIN